MRRSRRKKIAKETLKYRFVLWALQFFVVIFLLSLIPVITYRYFNPPTTPLMWIRWAENETFQTSPLVLESWVSLKDISPDLIKAIISNEDGKFFRHSGFDWGAIGDAFWHNLNSSKKLGASTISMQTARNAFLWQNRTWFRKILEAYYTILIEVFWSKARILEVYLNIIEWGDGVFGCFQAAQFYYSKTTKLLSAEDSAWLASLLPNPRILSKKAFTNKRLKERKRILKRMKMIQIPASILKSAN